MTVTDLYSSAQYVVDEDGNQKAVLDWHVWKDIVSLLKKLEGREAELAGWDSGEASLNIEPDTEQAAANQTALALLHTLDEIDDEREQRQTWTYLQQALDEDRLSNRPLFLSV